MASVQKKLSRRSLLLALLGAPGALRAQSLCWLRLGSGSDLGLYYEIASAIAKDFNITKGSSLAGDEDCNTKALLAQRSSGSVYNIEDLRTGHVDFALVQSDVAFWAYHGIDAFANQHPYKHLRLLAHLYPECMHLVVRRGHPARTIEALAGAQIGVGEPGSGTLVQSLRVLQMANLQGETQHLYVNLMQSVRLLREGEIDAFFFLAGYPVSPIKELLSEGVAELISPLRANSMGMSASYLFYHNIPAYTYPRLQRAIPTVAVGAQLISDEQLAPQDAYAVLQSTWEGPSGESWRRRLHSGGPDQAVIANLPLHEGARRFYLDRGIIQ